MSTFLLALALVVLLVTGMAIGVIFGRKPIAGTCGGLNNMGSKGACEICGGNPAKCDENVEQTARLSYDATSGTSSRG